MKRHIIEAMLFAIVMPSIPATADPGQMSEG